MSRLPKTGPGRPRRGRIPGGRSGLSPRRDPRHGPPTQRPPGRGPPHRSRKHIHRHRLLVRTLMLEGPDWTGKVTIFASLRAQPRAASRSSTSMTVKPPRCSLPSVKGPSVMSTSSPCGRRTVAVSAGWKAGGEHPRAGHFASAWLRAPSSRMMGSENCASGTGGHQAGEMLSRYCDIWLSSLRIPPAWCRRLTLYTNGRRPYRHIPHPRLENPWKIRLGLPRPDQRVAEMLACEHQGFVQPLFAFARELRPPGGDFRHHHAVESGPCQVLKRFGAALVAASGNRCSCPSGTGSVRQVDMPELAAEGLDRLNAVGPRGVCVREKCQVTSS